MWANLQSTTAHLCTFIKENIHWKLLLNSKCLNKVQDGVKGPFYKLFLVMLQAQNIKNSCLVKVKHLNLPWPLPLYYISWGICRLTVSSDTCSRWLSNNQLVKFEIIHRDFLSTIVEKNTTYNFLTNLAPFWKWS